MSWLDKLKGRWKLTGGQVIIVLIVFACTGFTVLFLKNPILSLILPENEGQWWYSLLYYIFILPIYNVVLLIYGFLFGQFSFFWEFEKRMFKRLFKVKFKSKAKAKTTPKPAAKPKTKSRPKTKPKAKSKHEPRSKTRPK